MKQHLHLRASVRRRAAALTIGLACVAGPAIIGVGSGHAGAAAPQAVPGDRHSAVVADLAGQTLDALGTRPASGWSSTPGAGDAAFRTLLARTAAATAAEMGVEARELQFAWLAADQQHQVAMLTALTQLGVRYQSMSSDPAVGFDCSGLTSYAWAAAGLEIPRQSGAQIDDASARTADNVMAGDLVQYPGHVMISLGLPGVVVHASNPETDVELWIASESRANSLRYGDPTD